MWVQWAADPRFDWPVSHFRSFSGHSTEYIQRILTLGEEKRHHNDQFMVNIHPITRTPYSQNYVFRVFHGIRLVIQPQTLPVDARPPCWRGRLVRFSCRYIQSICIRVDADICPPLPADCCLQCRHPPLYNMRGTRTAMIMAR